MKIDKFVLLALVICALVFLGEYCTYGSNLYRFDSSVTHDSDGFSYSVYSSGSDVYDVVFLESADPIVESMTIYIDPTYGEHYDEALRISQPARLDQEHYYVQISEGLKMRNYDSVSKCGPGELERFLESTLSDCSSKGLMIMSYALPASVYTGDQDDLFIRWLNAGGKLYWMGSEIGRHYVDDEGLHTVEGNQELFFGHRCINTGSTVNATNVVQNGFTEALDLKNSNLAFALDVTGFEKSLQMGYYEGDYASIAMVGIGSGVLCMFSGAFDVNQVDDIGQVVAAGIGIDTEILGSHSGKVVRGIAEGEFETDVQSAYAYVFIGGIYVKYGEAFHG